MPMAATTVQFDAVTHSLMRIDRYSMESDSLRWVAQVDSVRRAMAARHAEVLPCTSSSGVPIVDAWGFSRREARLYAGWIRPAPRAQRRSGYVSIELVPRGAFGCGREWRLTWLTPNQLARAARMWVEDHLGI